MSGFDECCLRGFTWDGTPSGRESKLAGLDTYIAGHSPSNAVLYIHDALGWTWENARLLADHYAREAGVTVYMPDFFGGEKLPRDLVLQGRFGEIDMASWASRNGRQQREPEIVSCARALREKYSFVGAIGFCYGGWAVFRLGAEEFYEQPKPLIDCGIAGHPSLFQKSDADEMRAPVQVLSPEFDQPFNEELRLHTWKKLQENKVKFDWQFMPGVAHGCLTKGSEEIEGEREAMLRGKNAAVWWLKLHLSKSI